jgi:hypothetical protein
VSAEVIEALQSAHLKGERATAYADRRAEVEATRELMDIAYNATDPDYTVGAQEAERWMLTREIERELIRHYERGVCCFSTTYSSPLLWSHYGDQHRGVCVGYGIDRTPKPQLQKVIYGGNRNVKTSTLARAFICYDPKARDDIDRDVLLRKARGWSYEREWRLIGARGLQDSPLLLQEVTFGLRCTSSVMHAVVQALSGRERPVQFFEVHEFRGRYILHRRRLDIGELAAGLPRMAASGEEMFGPYIDSDSPSTESDHAANPKVRST